MASKRPEVGKFLFPISLPFPWFLLPVLPIRLSTVMEQLSRAWTPIHAHWVMAHFSASRVCTLYSSSLEQHRLVHQRCGKLSRVCTPEVKHRNSPFTNHHGVAYSILNCTMSTVLTQVVVEGREKKDARIDRIALHANHLFGVIR